MCADIFNLAKTNAIISVNPDHFWMLLIPMRGTVWLLPDSHSARSNNVGKGGPHVSDSGASASCRLRGLNQVLFITVTPSKGMPASSRRELIQYLVTNQETQSTGGIMKAIFSVVNGSNKYISISKIDNKCHFILSHYQDKI